jgi:hypothetical protein
MNEDLNSACSPGHWCGSCPTPCFLNGEGDAFDSLLDQEPDSEFDELSEAVNDTDTFALGCFRWEDPEADCDACAGNFFCFADAESAI